MERSNLEATSHVKKDRFSIPLIIIFIIFDVVCDNIILINFNKETSYVEISLFIGLLCLQIIASPIQAGLSDVYGRKKGLITSLSATLLSLIILFLHSSRLLPYFIVLVLTNLVKGLFGNTIPIVWSAIGDTDNKNERFFFAVSEAGYAFGYLLILLFSNYLTDNAWLILLSLISPVLIYFCKKKFKDVKDADCQQHFSFYECVIEEPRLIINDLHKKSLRMLSYCFTLWEISLYCILILYADFNKFGSPFVGASMMLGYIFGSFMMKFATRFSNYTMIKIGYTISLFSLIPYIFMSFIFKDIYYLLVIGYFFHAIGNAILCPTLLSLVSEGVEPRQKGKRFGILESFDTIAFLISSVIIMLYRKLDLGIIYIVVFSFLAMGISWMPYKIFTKLGAKTIR